MRKRLAAAAAWGWSRLCAAKRGMLLGLTVTTAAAVLSAPADIARGLAWLQLQVQAGANGVGSNSAQMDQTRCETAATLLKLAGAGVHVSGLIAAMQPAGNGAATETLACWQQLRQQLGEMVLSEELDARRAVGQGFVAYDGFGMANSLDTGWALAARLQALPAADKTALLAWLEAHQSEVGAFVVAGRRDMLATAVVLRGLKGEVGRNAVASSIASKAAAWLIGQRAPQGGWLGDPALSAIVFEAVHPYSGNWPAMASEIEGFLLAAQSSDGSWSGDAYATAVALRALALTSVVPVDATVPPGAMVRGVVTAAATGAPLAGVTVSAQPGGAAAKTVVTDGQGAFQMSGIAPGSIALGAALTGYQSVAAQVALQSGETALFLPALYAAGATPASGARIQGRVIAFGSNAPLAGALVQVAGATQASAQTGADGLFDLPLNAGAHTVTYAQAGYDAQTQQLALSSGVTAQVGPIVLLTVRSSSSLRGVVQDTAGRPLVGAVVSVQGSPPVTTSEGGTYAFGALAGRQFTAIVSASGYGSRSFSVSFPKPADYIQDFTLPRASSAYLNLSDLVLSTSNLGLRQELTATAVISNPSSAGVSAIAGAVVLDTNGAQVASLAGTDSAGNPLGTVMLQPGEQRPVRYKWNSGSFPPGSYTLLARLQEPGSASHGSPEGVVIASQQQPLAISPGASFMGSVSADPPVLRAGAGAPVKFTALVQNDGNVVLPAQDFRLAVVDTKSGQPVLTHTVSGNEIGVTQLRTLEFPDWTPAAGGSFRLELTASSTSHVNLTGTLYVGSNAPASFTVDRNVVPAGTQTVRGKIKVPGHFGTETIADPLAPLIRGAITKAVRYADSQAYNHYVNDLKCYACHVQAQAVKGGELNLRFTQPDDPLQRAAMVSAITQFQEDGGSVSGAVSSNLTRVTNTTIGLWGISDWHGAADLLPSSASMAKYLATRQDPAGFWESEDPLSWWRRRAGMTAVNVGSFGQLKKRLQASPAPKTHSVAYEGSSPWMNPEKATLTVGPDGTVYVANWWYSEVWTISPSGVASQLMRGAYQSVRALSNGRLLLAGTDGVRIRDASGSLIRISTLAARDAQPYGDKFLVMSYHADGTIYLVDTDGNASTLVRDNSLGTLKALNVQPDGTLLVSSSNKITQFSASGQQLRSPVPLTNGLVNATVPYRSGYLVATENGVFHYNNEWVGVRWLPDRADSLAVLPNGKVLLNNSYFLNRISEGNIDVPALVTALDASVDRAYGWLLSANGDFENANNVDLAFRLMGLANVKDYDHGTSRSSMQDVLIQSLAATLRSRQRADGGWVWREGTHTSSDSMVTALVSMALDTQEPSPNAPEVRKAIELLLSRQQADGSWRSENMLASTPLASSTWVEIWLPLMLDRLARLDTDVVAIFPASVSLSNPDRSPTAVLTAEDGSVAYTWQLRSVPQDGQELRFDLTLKDMQVDEVRPAAIRAEQRFTNSYVGGTMTAAMEVPKVAVTTQLTPGVTVDRPVYTEADQAIFTGIATNAGTIARDTTVRITVLDSAGQVVEALPLGAAISVPGLGNASSEALWPVAGVLSGNYVLRAELVAPSGLIYGTATTTFAVTASQAQSTSARVHADRVSYSAAQSVQLVSRVANSTTNTALNELQATTEVMSAAGQSVFSRVESIEQLAGGGHRQYDYSLGAGFLPAGNYTARLQLLSNTGNVLSQGTAGFAVLGTGQSGTGLTGALQASPSAVPIGQQVALTLAAVNNGDAALADVPVTVRIIDPVSGALIASFNSAVANWPQGATQSLAWNWSAQGLDGQTMVAAASASIGGRDVALGQANIRVLGVPQLKAEPLQLSFGPIYVGESASAAVTISSIGNVPATSLTFSLGGTDPSQYVLPQGGCTGAASLPVGTTCTAVISYRPQTAASHAGELRIAYTRADTMVVPLLGAAKPVLFSGTVSADPAELEAGQSVSLNYSVSNPANATARMSGNLSLQRSNGQSLDQWPLDLNAGPLASIARNQPYATGAEAQTLTVALSQQLGTASFVLATTTFTIVDPPVPVDVVGGLKGQSRILVLVSCPPGLGAKEDDACVAQRSQSIVAYLGGLGLSSKAVATRDAFVAEMRCGTYNTYWISGGALKLEAQSIAELREAVYRGEALWMDGVHDSRNQLLHPVAGVKELGKLPTSNQTASLAEDGVYGHQALHTLGQPGKFELISGRAQGAFTQIPGEQAPVPAVVSNVYGQGRSLLFAFDLAAMVSAEGSSTQNQLGVLVTNSASYTAGGSPTLTLGDLALVATSVTNQGTRTVVFRAEATLPAGLTITAVVPGGTSASDVSGSTTVTWQFTLAGGSTKELDLQLRALQPGSYGVPLVVYSLPPPGSTLAPRVRYSGSLPLEVRDPTSVLYQALAEMTAVQSASSSDGNNRSKALDAINQAVALHNQGSYEQALVQWVAAADAVAGVAATETAAARAAISLAMEATTDALCIQRCGSAVCQ